MVFILLHFLISELNLYVSNLNAQFLLAHQIKHLNDTTSLAKNLFLTYGIYNLFSHFCIPQDTTLVFIALDDSTYKIPQFFMCVKGR